MQYFLDLFPQLHDKNVMLEEVEESEDGLYWLITIGFDSEAPKSLATGFAATLAQLKPVVRRFKRFKIDALTGRVVAMNLRSLQ